MALYISCILIAVALFLSLVKRLCFPAKPNSKSKQEKIKNNKPTTPTRKSPKKKADSPASNSNSPSKTTKSEGSAKTRRSGKIDDYLVKNPVAGIENSLREERERKDRELTRQINEIESEEDEIDEVEAVDEEEVEEEPTEEVIEETKADSDEDNLRERKKSPLEVCNDLVSFFFFLQHSVVDRS